MGEALINVYCVDIKTKEISPDFGASAVAVSLTEDEDGGYSTYDIDFSSLRVFYDNIGYGVIAVNNGTVFPLYSESSGVMSSEK